MRRLQNARAWRLKRFVPLECEDEGDGALVAHPAVVQVEAPQRTWLKESKYSK